MHIMSDLVVSRKPSSFARRRPTNAGLRLVPLQAQLSTASDRTAASGDTSFGHRRFIKQRQRPTNGPNHNDEKEHVFRKNDGSVEVSWVPTTRSTRSDATRAETTAGADEDDLVGRPRGLKRALKDTRKGVERFGAGMEKGGEDPDMRVLGEQERSGRKQRRHGMRSGSKNAFRRTHA